MGCCIPDCEHLYKRLCWKIASELVSFQVFGMLGLILGGGLFTVGALILFPGAQKLLAKELGIKNLKGIPVISIVTFGILFVLQSLLRVTAGITLIVGLHKVCVS